MISCFQLKPCVKCFSNLFKKVLSWKSWLLSQKWLNWLNWMRNRSTPSSTGRGTGRPPTQPVKVWVNPQLNRSRSGSTPNSTGRGCKIFCLSSRIVVQPVKVELQSVEVRSRSVKNTISHPLAFPFWLRFPPSWLTSGRVPIEVRSRQG